MQQTTRTDEEGRVDYTDTLNDDGSETATGFDDNGNPTWSFEQDADGSGEFSDPDGTRVTFDGGELTEFSVGPDGTPTMSFDTDGQETDVSVNGDGTVSVSRDDQGEITVPGDTQIDVTGTGMSVDRIDPGPGDPGPGDPGPGDPGPGPGPDWPPSEPTPPVDPLVLDLDGDGIELIAVAQSQAHFDFDGDGFAEKTGWVAPHDGLLVRDANANGTVDGVSELFGNEVVDGFTALESLDGNQDGKIDAGDGAFGQLRVWRDLNGNGASGAGELSTLAAAGISAISLTRTAADEIIAGNRIGFTGSFTRTDSSTGTAVAAFFQTDRTLTQWNPPQGFEFSPDVWGLPGLKGYGQLPDLKYSMTLDAGLRADVRAFALASDTVSGGELRAQFEDLLFTWADVETVSPSSRGPHVDGQHLAFLEKFFGAPITQDTGGGPSSNPNARFGTELERNYALVSNALLTRFLSSVPATQFLLGADPLDAFDSPFLPLSGLRYHARSDGFGGDIAPVLADAFDAVPAPPQAAVEYIDRMVAAMAGAQTDFFGNNRSALQAAVSAAWDAAGGGDQALLEYTLLVTGAAPALTGAAGGGTIQGGSANDVLMGRQGNDQLTGNWGDDVYVYARGGGADEIGDGSYSANDRLLLPGINPSDVTLIRTADSEHLTLSIAGGGLVKLANQFNAVAPYIETVQFANGTTWSANQIKQMLLDAQSAAPSGSVYGFADSDDTLVAGLGGKYLSGSWGGDTYVYARAGGDASIADGTYSGGDKLLFTDVNPADVALWRDPNSYAVTLFVLGASSVTLASQYNPVQPDIETIQFANGAVWTHASLQAVLAAQPPVLPGTLGNDVLNGTGAAEILIGRAGNDTLNGGAGADILDGGTGADILDGGAGDDRFLYAAGGGADTIFGFAAGAGSEDKIDLTAFTGVRTLAAVLARTSQQGANAVIDFGGGDTLALANVAKTSLAAGDFILADAPTDFNGDGKSDILWQHQDGTPAVWLMQGTTPAASAVAGWNPGAAWDAIGAGDFNGDGKDDILWQAADGTPAVWLMDAMAPVASGVPGYNPGASWNVVGAGDFNGDGKSDILWQAADGTPAIWLMDGIVPVASGVPNYNPGAGAEVIGAGDFNCDGKDDILWQAADGTPHISLMDGMVAVVSAIAGWNPGASWNAIGAGDFNGDGKDDILWQNDDGTPSVWLMDGTTPTSAAIAGWNPGAAWNAIRAGDFNGDDKHDILWQNDDGTPSIWLMDGATPLATAIAGSNPGVSWHLV